MTKIKSNPKSIESTKLTDKTLNPNPQMKQKTETTPASAMTDAPVGPVATNAPVLPLYAGTLASEPPVEPVAVSEPTTPGTSAEPLTPERPKLSGKKLMLAERDEYVATFLSPHSVTKKHGINIDDSLWEELDTVVRRFGKRGSTVTALVHHILRDHLDRNAQNHEVWRKL